MDASCTDRRSLAIGQKGSELKFAIPVKENVRQMIVLSQLAAHVGKSPADYYSHNYRTDLCSRLFVPAVFGPGTIDGFCPGSNG